MSCDILTNLDWLSDCPALTEVMLFDNPVLRCVRGVGQCRALESLIVKHSGLVDDLSALSACPRLENLECVGLGVKLGSKLPSSPRLKEVSRFHVGSYAHTPVKNGPDGILYLLYTPLVKYVRYAMCKYWP